MTHRRRGTYDTDGDLMRAYCQTVEELQDHCEETDQNFRQVMIDLIEAKLKDERKGRDARKSKDHK